MRVSMDENQEKEKYITRIRLIDARSLSFKMYGLFDISVYLDSHGVNKQDETSFGYKAFRSLFRQPLILSENKIVTKLAKEKKTIPLPCIVSSVYRWVTLRPPPLPLPYRRHKQAGTTRLQSRKARADKLRNEGQTDRKKRTRQVTSDTHGRERGKGQGQCATHLYKVKQYSHYLYSEEPYIRPFCFRVQRVIFRKFFYHHSFCRITESVMICDDHRSVIIRAVGLR